jgi:hypothetical protein
LSALGLILHSLGYRESGRHETRGLCRQRCAERRRALTIGKEMPWFERLCRQRGALDRSQIALLVRAFGASGAHQTHPKRTRSDRFAGLSTDLFDHRRGVRTGRNGLFLVKSRGLACALRGGTLGTRHSRGERADGSWNRRVLACSVGRAAGRPSADACRRYGSQSPAGSAPVDREHAAGVRVQGGRSRKQRGPSTSAPPTNSRDRRRAVRRRGRGPRTRRVLCRGDRRHARCVMPRYCATPRACAARWCSRPCSTDPAKGLK